MLFLLWLFEVPPFGKEVEGISDSEGRALGELHQHWEEGTLFYGK